MKKQFFAAVGATLTLMGTIVAIPQNAMAAIDANREKFETAPVLVTRVSKWSDSVSMVLRKQPVTGLLPTHVMVMYVNQDHSTVSNSEKSLETKDLGSIYYNFDMLVDIDVKDIPGFEEGIEIKFGDDNSTMVAGHSGISQISTHNIYYFVRFGNEENYEYGRAYYGMCSTSTDYLRVSGTECRLTQEQLYGMNAYKVANLGDEYTELNELGIYETKEQKLAAEEAARKAAIEAARLEVERLETEKAALESEIVQLEVEKTATEEELTQLAAEKVTTEEELAQLDAEKIAAGEKLAQLEAKFAQLETEKVTLEEELLRLETEKTALEEEIASLETEKTTLGEEIARLETEKSEAEKISLVQQTELVKTTPIIAYVAEDNSVYENQIEKTEAKELELPALGEEKTCEKVEEKNSFFDNWWWAIALVSFLLGGLFLDIKVYKTSRK